MARLSIGGLPDEMQVAIAEELVEDLVEVLVSANCGLKICQPSSVEVSAVGLCMLSNILLVEYKIAMHKKCVLEFDRPSTIGAFFNPKVLQNDPTLARIRLSTRNIRINRWQRFSTWVSVGHALKLLGNFKSLHIYERFPGDLVPSVIRDIARRTLPLALKQPTTYPSMITFGPGAFGKNTKVLEYYRVRRPVGAPAPPNAIQINMGLVPTTSRQDPARIHLPTLSEFKPDHLYQQLLSFIPSEKERATRYEAAVEKSKATRRAREEARRAAVEKRRQTLKTRRGSSKAQDGGNGVQG